jgi:hypothetical protein
MGRTYSFEPFLSQQPAQGFKGSGPRLGNDEDKVTLTKDMEKDTLPKSATSYGQAHSETVKRYRARAQARKRAAKAPAQPAAKAKKTTPQATRKAPARKSADAVATKAPARQTAAAKAPARPTAAAVKSSVRKSAVEAITLGAIGRKVVARAAVAAKKTVVRAVKKAVTRKQTKKR